MTAANGAGGVVGGALSICIKSVWPSGGQSHATTATSLETDVAIVAASGFCNMQRPAQRCELLHSLHTTPCHKWRNCGEDCLGGFPRNNARARR
jgi:hypothetical protein